MECRFSVGDFPIYPLASRHLLRIMKTQNELLENVNKKLHREVSDFKEKFYR